MKLKLYTTHCPQCNIITKMLENKGVDYEVEDNHDTVMKLAEENNLTSVPFAFIPEKNEIVGFDKLLKHVRSL